MTRDGPHLPLRAGARLGSTWRDRAFGLAEALLLRFAAHARLECSPHAGTGVSLCAADVQEIAGNGPATPVCAPGAEHMLCFSRRCVAGASIPPRHQRLLYPRRAKVSRLHTLARPRHTCCLDRPPPTGRAGRRAQGNSKSQPSGRGAAAAARAARRQQWRASRWGAPLISSPDSDASPTPSRFPSRLPSHPQPSSPSPAPSRVE